MILALISAGSSGDRGEHGTAAGEDDLSASLIPAGGHGLQLGGAEKLAPYCQE